MGVVKGADMFQSVPLEGKTDFFEKEKGNKKNT